MDYLDFDLEIAPGLGQDYHVTVSASPAGEARETMHFPFSELELENRVQAVQLALLRSGTKQRRVLNPAEQSVQAFGQRLFDALLTGEVRTRYDVSRREAARQGMGLRIKLRMRSPPLAAVPWEFLYDPRQQEYICFSRHSPLIRYLEAQQPSQPLAVQLPLRILGMVAAPTELVSLDIDQEKQRTQRALEELQAKGVVELAWVEGQTWQVLQGTLARGAYTGALADLQLLAEGDENAIQGDAVAMTDRLLLTTNGAEFIFTIDGKIVYTLPVAAYHTGQVGFIVITQADVTKVHIHYNWVKVQKIDPFSLSLPRDRSMSAQ